VRKPSTKHRKLHQVVGALVILVNGCNAAPNHVFEETFEQAYTIGPTANVTIRNGDGAVLLYGSNVDQMQVHAVKRAYSQRRLAEIGIDVRVEADSVSITTRFPPKPAWGLSDRSGTVDYTIVVPAAASVSELELNAGEILLDGMRGSATHARLNMGRIFARNCFSRNLDLAITRGNLMLSYDWWEEETLSARVNVSQGNAWAFLPVDAAFHLLAETNYGKIVNDFNNAALEAVMAKRMKIDRVVNGGDQSMIQIRVTKGNISVEKANR
jgi:hypothetical protein